MEPCLFYTDGYYADIGAHVFPMQKFALTRELLLQLGAAGVGDFVAPQPALDEQVLAVHSPYYVRRVKELALSDDEVRVLEVPLSQGLVSAFWLVAGGTVQACRRALDCGYAANLAGGFHHAFPDHGEGFCLLNDVAIGARAVLDERRAERVAVLDLDVHQGNGTAAALGRDPRVFTCSIHQENNYPYLKQTSDLDIGLADGSDVEVYRPALERALTATLAHRPQLLIYVAGADPYEHDQLGGLALTIDDLRERDRLVFERYRAAGVPVVVTLAGGYAAEVFDTVFIHAATIGLGLELCGPGRPEG
jgi:acetoin utilization deacetylase AcuC-like enzyme